MHKQMMEIYQKGDYFSILNLYFNAHDQFLEKYFLGLGTQLEHEYNI